MAAAQPCKSHGLNPAGTQPGQKAAPKARSQLDTALRAGLETVANSGTPIFLLGDRGLMSSSGDGDRNGRSLPAEESDRLKERLRELERKLDTEGSNERETMSEQERGRRSSALGKAFRLSTELVAGVFVGGFVGWLLDRWLKTLPLFLVVFLLLGIAAGLTNAVREARRMGDK